MSESVFKSLLRDILGKDGVAKGVRAGRDITAYEAFMGFYHAVTWSDPGVTAILCFHILYAIACASASWLPVEAQGAMFLLTCGFVYSASYINSYLAGAEGKIPRWSTHGFTQNYFDKQGVFMAHIFCAPLLIIAFAQMVSIGNVPLNSVRSYTGTQMNGSPPPHPHTHACLRAALFSKCCLQTSS